MHYSSRKKQETGFGDHITFSARLDFPVERKSGCNTSRTHILYHMVPNWKSRLISGSQGNENEKTVSENPQHTSTCLLLTQIGSSVTEGDTYTVPGKCHMLLHSYQAMEKEIGPLLAHSTLFNERDFEFVGIFCLYFISFIPAFISHLLLSLSSLFCSVCNFFG